MSNIFVFTRDWD